MTIINHASDGIYPELIALFRVIANHGKIDREEIIRVCSANNFPRLRGTLSRWTELGLFVDEDQAIKLDARFVRKRGESLDDFTGRLPLFCRELILEAKHCLPLWPASGEVTEENSGKTADFARGMAWALAQDIYNFPSSSAEDVEGVEHQQIRRGKFIFLNKTRWPGLRFWARYLGFATGDDGTFLIDPTTAVKSELSKILHVSKSVPADIFIKELSIRLPVLDFGVYRKEVESVLSEESWRRPAERHLSMSLSFALRRLLMDNTISLDIKADAGQGFALTGRNYRIWMQFTHVRLMRKIA